MVVICAESWVHSITKIQIVLRLTTSDRVRIGKSLENNPQIQKDQSRPTSPPKSSTHLYDLFHQYDVQALSQILTAKSKKNPLKMI